MKQNELSMDLIDQIRFSAAVREAIFVLDQTAACYKLTEKSYYLEIKEFLENRAEVLEETYGSYLRKNPPRDCIEVVHKHLEDFVERDIPKQITDVPGIALTPGDPNNCPGNGLDPEVECQCDGCDYLIECCGVPGPDQERNAPSEDLWWKK